MIKPVSCSRGKHALGAETRTSGTVVCFTVEFLSSLLTPSTPELSTVSTIYKMYTVRDGSTQGIPTLCSSRGIPEVCVECAAQECS